MHTHKCILFSFIYIILIIIISRYVFVNELTVLYILVATLHTQTDTYADTHTSSNCFFLDKLLFDVISLHTKHSVVLSQYE